MKGRPKMTAFEKKRQQQIAENRKLLETLDVDKAVEAVRVECEKAVRVKPKRTFRRKGRSVKRDGHVRRSRRLEGKVPIYNERLLARQSVSIKKSRRRYTMDVTREEIYTQEHVKLLGSYEKEWMLFVDGYDENGERVYDSVDGMTCHQCRQKTIGKRTVCSKCNKLRGCFCGDCLFMRYGENVDEVNAKKDWICPGCRGICNCSFCRKAKGWAPTGALFRTAIAEGYKSVAHYLILRNLTDKENVSPPEEENDTSAEDKGEKPQRMMTRSKLSAQNAN